MNSFSINQPNTDEPVNDEPVAKTTGRHLALFKNYEEKDALKKVRSKTGLKLACSDDYDTKQVGNSIQGVSTMAFNEKADGIYLSRVGVAVLGPDADPGLVDKMRKDSEMMVEAEQFVYASDSLSSDYLRGYSAAARHLYEESLDGQPGQQQATGTGSLPPSPGTNSHWALEITSVLTSRYSGKGVGIAILDTGFSFDHADFGNRVIQQASFVEGVATADDGHGHGTHCAGIAAGPQRSGREPRYGVAHEANLFVGKVLNDRGRGDDTSVLDGIDWAIGNNCRVISLSLGSPTEPNQPYSELYERIARRAIMQGTIIVAAAGNNSNRRLRQIKTVNRPADSPSIIAVGAIDRNRQIANFSCGGSVDLVAPGVDIWSCYRKPDYWRLLSGTSMATPFVAGIVALMVEAQPEASALTIRDLLTKNALPINLPAYDTGYGLVQAV